MGNVSFNDHNQRDDDLSKRAEHIDLVHIPFKKSAKWGSSDVFKG